jgi:hypothetical protein
MQWDVPGLNCWDKSWDRSRGGSSPHHRFHVLPEINDRVRRLGDFALLTTESGALIVSEYLRAIVSTGIAP